MSRLHAAQGTRRAPEWRRTGSHEEARSACWLSMRSRVRIGRIKRHNVAFSDVPPGDPPPFPAPRSQ
jgi:hypothetical protein